MWWLIGIGAFLVIVTLVGTIVALITGSYKELVPVLFWFPVGAVLLYLGWRKYTHRKAVPEEAAGVTALTDSPSVDALSAEGVELQSEPGESHEIMSAGRLGGSTGETWQLQFSDEWLSFVSQDDQSSFRIGREKARDAIKMPVVLPKWGKAVQIRVDSDAGRRNFKVGLEIARRITSWIPLKSDADLKKYLRVWGIVLVALALAHFFIPFLDPVWGGFIIVLGLLNLLVVKRGMIIVNGTALIIVGFLNMYTGFAPEVARLCLLGLLQMVWGIQELTKFKGYEKSA